MNNIECNIMPLIIYFHKYTKLQNIKYNLSRYYVNQKIIINYIYKLRQIINVVLKFKVC